MKTSLGILITNTGTPDSPAVKDVRRYLKSFLSDPAVVRIPRIVWLPILHLFVLPLRAAYSAKLYQKIWTADGSPLKTTMNNIARQLECQLAADNSHHVAVECGMHYGNPSIADAIKKLRQRNIEQLMVLPLFPQYSTSTSETTFNLAREALSQYPQLAPQYVSHYATHPAYIDILAQHIKAYRKNQDYLLFSFHGLPQQFVMAGDPYAEHCHLTSANIAKSLQLSSEQWSIAYQSRFGYAKWLKPYTFDILKELPKRGIKNLTVICPGFAVDCLETLEEIQIRGKNIFLEHGGESFQYIPALNATPAQITLLSSILFSEKSNDKLTGTSCNPRESEH